MFMGDTISSFEKPARRVFACERYVNQSSSIFRCGVGRHGNVMDGEIHTSSLSSGTLLDTCSQGDANVTSTEGRGS